MKNKTPAVLWYPEDFETGTRIMTDEEVGIYVRLLNNQNIHGRLNIDYIRRLMPHHFIDGNPDEPLTMALDKFTQDDHGLYFNMRMEEEIAKRNTYKKSRETNGNKGGRPKNKNLDETIWFSETKPKQNLDETIWLSKTKPTQNHIETETETNIDNLTSKDNLTPSKQSKDNQVKQSKYNKVSKDNKNNKYKNIIYKKIINHLNQVCGTNYKHTSKATQEKINARLNEGYKLDDFIAVIDNKASDWLNDAKMAEYLRPQTLFGTKFESYLNKPKKRGTGNKFLDLLMEKGGDRK